MESVEQSGFWREFRYVSAPESDAISSCSVKSVIPLKMLSVPSKDDGHFQVRMDILSILAGHFPEKGHRRRHVDCKRSSTAAYRTWAAAVALGRPALVDEMADRAARSPDHYPGNRGCAGYRRSRAGLVHTVD